ncbi:MAG: molybdopterin cofactor-binding domain-containing protein [Vicinamibacteria bacterium]
MKRRGFLGATAVAGAGLVIGLRLDGLFAEEATPSSPKPPPNPFDAWVRVDAAGDVTLTCGKSEMGQGVHTCLAQILAEELDVDWSRVRVQQALTNPAVYDHDTGGSSSTRDSYTPLRQAGAAARAMLIGAAAARWGVAPGSCRTDRGEVVHPATGRRLAYGALVEAAAKLPLPDFEKVVLKDAKDFRIIGTSIPRTDIPSKVDGTASFGIDVRVPGMLFAVVARCPTVGGKVKSFDTTKAKAVPGVRHVVEIAAVGSPVFSTGGVAVVAESTWAAMRGREALQVVWDHGPHAGESDATLRKIFEEMTGKPGTPVRSEGDAQSALARAERKIEAVYETPFQAHAAMEPLNATVDVRKDRAEAWLATQGSQQGQEVIAQIAGLPQTAVVVHTTMMGGGFGRRGTADFVAEAAQVSKAVGAPVQVLWTREDDMEHDFYRPAAMQRLSAAIDASGTPVAWLDRMSSVSIARMWDPPDKLKPESSEIEGAADIPYAIPNIQVEYGEALSGVPRLWWRSVEHSTNGFVVESFVDELAAAAKADPLAFRLKLLAGDRTVRLDPEDKSPGLETRRLRACLELAATRAGWGSPLPAGRARGIAGHFSFESYVAHVVELSVEKGLPRVHRVVSAVDCGVAVNPDGVAAQVESAIVYGLSAALKGSITIAEGKAQQSNFDSFEVLRIDEMPVVEVHIVPSHERPTGMGEPALPPIAAAVGNALFALTGKRVRRLPIRKADLA